MPRLIKNFLGLLMFLIGAGSCTRQSSDPWYANERLLYAGIPVTVRFQPADEALGRAVFRYLEQADDVFNDYRPESELGQLNQAPAGKPFRVSAALANVLRLSLEMHTLTDGAFDITVGPLIRVWKDAAKRGTPPTAEELARTLASIGAARIALQGQDVTFLASGMRLDLGGIAKGLFVDQVASQLRRKNIHAAMVQIGGETAVFGLSSEGKPSVIGIRHPEDMHRIWSFIQDPGTGLSVSTSGNYNRPIRIADTTFYHIVDPRTGRPIATDLLSITVAFPSSGKNALADALSTAGAILGPARFLPLAQKLGAEALLILRENGKIQERKTPGWDRLARAR